MAAPFRPPLAALLTAALEILLSVAGPGAVRADCVEEIKSARTSGERVYRRLRCDRSVYSKVKYSVDGRVLSLKTREDGATEVTFGGLSTRGWAIGPEEQEFPPQESFVPQRLSGTATLIWRDKERPVPLAIEMSVVVGIDSQRIVHAFSYSISRLIAVHKRLDGFWEELIQVSKHNHAGQPLLALFANHTGLDGPEEAGEETDIQWNDVLGLCKGYWGDCGGGEAETEGISSVLHGLGWAPANAPQLRIRPGRDGWIRLNKSDRTFENRKKLVPAAQFLNSSC